MAQTADVGVTAEGDDLVARTSSSSTVRIPFRHLKRILAIRFGERFLGWQRAWLIFEADPISVVCDEQECPGANWLLFDEWRERIDSAGILRTADAVCRPRQFRRRGLFSPAPKLFLMTRDEVAAMLSATGIVESNSRPLVMQLDLEP